MAKARTESALAKRVGGVDPALLMKYTETDNSLASLMEYRILPRTKVIQGLSDQSLKDKFGEGAAIVRPGDALIAKKGETFLFVPQFFFAEFAKWADRRDKESKMVLERSFDPTSDIAKNARDEHKRFELYKGQEKKKEGDQFKYRYVEHLRFPGVIYGDHVLAGTPTVISFERGEFIQGKSFISAIALRRQIVDLPDNGGKKPIPVPLWAQVWALTPALRDKNGNKWFGLDYKNPSDVEGKEYDNVIRDEDFPVFQAENQSLLEIHKANKLRVEDEDADAGETASVDSAEGGKY